MKKTIVVVAAILSCFAAKAASVLWEAGDVFEYGTSEYAEGYVAYWVDASSTSLSDAQSALAAGKYDFLTNASEGYSAGGYIDQVAVTGYANATAVTGYVVIFDSDTIADASHYYVSESITKSTGAEGQAAGMVFDTSDTEIANSWSAIYSGDDDDDIGGGSGAVPEPTSGLLLLLGVAGLALKRKCA